jgi:TonB-dependent SusC/RagA subfamily outer membrane receptor
MKNQWILVAFGLAILSVFSGFLIINDPIADLIKKMDAYNLAHPQEKVHLHLDKPNYLVGDDIWFKAYLINTADSKLSKLSGVLNVEFINSRDSLLQYRKLAVTNGQANGDFKLFDSLPEGAYRIRAYTRLMQNLGPEFFFDKTIQVGSPSGKKVFVAAKYSYIKQKTGYQVIAVLTFKDKDGKAYAAKEVSFQVQLGDETILEGSDKTNAAGALELVWNNTGSSVASPASVSHGKISALLTVSDQIKISSDIPIKSTADSADVQFFPESGELVEGIRSKIGMKSLSSFGTGLNMEGTVLDSKGTIVTRFHTSNLGMGSFALRPLAGMSYTAKVKFVDGSERTFSLPKAKAAGYVLEVDNLDTALVAITLYASPSLFSDEELKLVVQHNGNMLLIFKPVAKNAATDIIIPRKNLPQGIIQLTLFSANMQPLVERLFFNSNFGDAIETTLSSSNSTYSAGGTVDLELTAKSKGSISPAYYSVAVTNADLIDADLENESNIFTSLLLTSDLTGFVEQPNHYFVDTTRRTRTELDNLLLTQGWRRFLWKDVLSANGTTPAFTAEKNFRISGTVLSAAGKPIPKGKVSLFAPENGSFTIDTIADGKGRFNFDQLVFNDGTKFIIQAANAKGKQDVRVTLDPAPAQVVTKQVKPAAIVLNANELISLYMIENNPDLAKAPTMRVSPGSIGLKEVKIKARKKVIVTQSANLNGAGVADQVIKGVDMGTCINLAECLKGRVVGYTLRNDTPFLARSPFIPMMLSLDGVLIDGSRLKDVNPSDIETIEVLKTPINTAIYGMRGVGGIIVINTKRQVSGTSMVHTKPWIVSYKPIGFAQSRVFYSPKYDATNKTQITDTRRTVYWKPDAVTDAQGKSKISFNTGNQAGNYRVVAEGINAKGQLGRTVYTYMVK